MRINTNVYVEGAFFIDQVTQPIIHIAGKFSPRMSSLLTQFLPRLLTHTDLTVGKRHSLVHLS